MPTYPLPGLARPNLIELALDLLQDQVQRQFNAYLTQVADEYANDGRKIALEPLQPNNIYISEGVKALKLPALFLIPDRSEFDLTAQNVNVINHSIILGIVVEDVQAESSRITRKIMRYGQAAWLTLHDRFLGGPEAAQQIHVLIENETYSPTIEGRGETGDRKFRKDVTFHLRVQHFEALYT
jgi:hypothetical protein